MGEPIDAGGGYRLRRWTPADGPAVLAALAPAAGQVQAAGQLPAAGQVQAAGQLPAAGHWVRARREEWVTGTGYGFAVVDARDTVLGGVAVTGIDRRRGTGWVSYWTAPAVRGRGVATRAVRALARWSYRELGLIRLELGHRGDNRASCVVAVRAGFRVRGGVGGGPDVELHARLASDPDPSA